MSDYIDFNLIKDSVTLEQVMQMLGLKLKRSGNQFRGSCPVHGGTDRTLVVTPQRGFFCFSEKKGGDQIALCAHVKEIGNKEAAKLIAEHFRFGGKPASSSAPPAKDGLQPLDYLDPTHEALELLCLSPDVCIAIGIGYAPKGTMNGRVLVPLRLGNGTLVGYLGIATKSDQAPLLKFPDNLDEKCGVSGTVEEQPEVKSQDKLRKLLRVV
jgi:hypothetical protein